MEVTQLEKFIQDNPSKLDSKVLDNILAKIKSGKVPTQNERRILDELINPWNSATVEDKAKILGIGKRTWLRYAKNGCPTDSQEVAIKWIMDHEALKGSGKPLTIGGRTFTAADILQLTAESKKKDNELKDLQIKIRSIKFQQKQGELVPLWVMQFILTTITGDLRFQLERLFTTVTERGKNPADPDRIKIVMREELDTFYKQLETANARASELLTEKLKEEQEDDE